MPKQSQDIPIENLERRIDELVASMDAETQRLHQQITDAARPDEDFATDAMTASIAPAAQARPSSPDAAPPAAPTKAAPSLDAQVERMLSDAAASVPAAHEASAQATAAVDAIDGKLAELADELLEGDLDNADALIGPHAETARTLPDEHAEPPGTPGSTADDSAGDDDMLDGDFDDLQDAIAQAGTQPPPPKAWPQPDPIPAPPPEANPATPPPEPIAPPQTATTRPVAPWPAPAPQDEPDPAHERTVTHGKPAVPRKPPTRASAPGGHRPRTLARAAVARSGQVAYALAERLTKPLDSRPSQLKDITGWLAAVTLFNAAAVWVFLLIGRGPAPGTSTQPAVDLVGQTSATIADDLD